MYSTPMIDVVGRASDLVQGAVFPGSDAGVGSLQKSPFSSLLEQ